MTRELSTWPGFAIPPSPESDWKWLKDYDYRRVARAITLDSRAVVPIPLLLWNTRAMAYEGTAEIDALNDVLHDFNKTLFAQPYTDPLLATPGSAGPFGRVRIWAPDYGGTTVGPFKSVFASIEIQSRPECRDKEYTKEEIEANRMATDPYRHWFWWLYYSTSPVNSEFKQRVWGIDNKLTQLETSYNSPVKTVQLLEDGEPVLRMRCDLNRADGFEKRKDSQADQPTFKLRTVARLRLRKGDFGENWSAVKVLDNISFAVVPDPISDSDFWVRRDSTIAKALARVHFKPRKWQFFPNYVGIVELWDLDGASTDTQLGTISSQAAGVYERGQRPKQEPKKKPKRTPKRKPKKKPEEE